MTLFTEERVWIRLPGQTFFANIELSKGETSGIIKLTMPFNSSLHLRVIDVCWQTSNTEGDDDEHKIPIVLIEKNTRDLDLEVAFFNASNSRSAKIDIYMIAECYPKNS